jgi:hypothetical protein
MPDLHFSLRDLDLGHLRIVAEMWGVDLDEPDARSALPVLVTALNERDLVAEVIESLPEAAQTALAHLAREGGRLRWTQFTRRYGQVREMGPGRRDRERPDRTPISPAEALWYRALVARAFFDTADGPEEFAYIPDDLLAIIPKEGNFEAELMGRPANPVERAQTIPVTDDVIDDACTLLAALRLGLSDEEVKTDLSIPPKALHAILLTAGLIDQEGKPLPEPCRDFLEAPRGSALARLASAWRESRVVNDLRLVPHLEAEGEWENDPLRARQAVFAAIENLPPDTWWSLPAFVEAFHEHQPDFQRPAGDYDSWFIRDRHTGEFLRGFEAWDRVDGALLHYLVRGPLHWLGYLELASPAEGDPTTAFRPSPWYTELLQGDPPDSLPPEDRPVKVRSDGSLRVPRLASRAVRYQIARFSRWEGKGSSGFRYRLTPPSLARARAQGLRVGHLLAILQRAAETIPPNLMKALDRWDREGVEAHLQTALVLRLANPEMLTALRHSRAARFLGDPLGPTAVIVKIGAEEKVLAILAELGYLAEVE